MALPQKVVEQLSREPVQAPGWASGLVMFSSTIFIVGLFIYLGLSYGYQPYLRAEVEKLDRQIEAFKQQVPAEEQAKIVSFYSQLANLKTVLGRHVLVFPTFGWLERNTQGDVYFTKFTLNSQSRQLALSGIARTVGDLGEQLAVFERDPSVERATFSNVFIGSNGLWQFDLTLSFKEDFFRMRNS
ncbi:hypothetical protein C4587_00570 [Candidatus Parcubacteria bacterium]|nr:MAG: hypothetical protein C4587_00570 [Candidatus Parcubacteria bacterium]